MKNRRILLASRPRGEATLADFELVEQDVEEPADGHIVVRNRWLSIDPYMRGRMNEARSYATPQPLGEVMIGQTAGEIVASRSDKWNVGDTVVCMGGWQEYATFDGDDRRAVRRVDASQIPLSVYLGAVGMPGVTAWYGLDRILGLAEGKTLVVSAAAGAVGSVVGQLGKRRGLRVVGIAGGPRKCGWVTEVAGFDACVDHRAHPDARALGKALARACPDGIDGYFDNVGGKVLDAVLVRMNPFGRIAMCGAIASYDGQVAPIAQPQIFVQSRLRAEGFIISDHPEIWPEALRELGRRFVDGELHHLEDVAVGLPEAPASLLRVLRGENFGKQLVALTQ